MNVQHLTRIYKKISFFQKIHLFILERERESERERERARVWEPEDEGEGTQEES